MVFIIASGPQAGNRPGGQGWVPRLVTGALDRV